MSFKPENQIKALEFAKDIAVFLKEEREKKGLSAFEIYYAMNCVIQTLPSPNEPAPCN